MPVQSLSFRRAVPSDVPAVVSLVESAYRGDSSRAGWTTEADLLEGQRTDAEEVQALIAQKHGLLLLAFAGEALVASLALSAIGDARAYLGMFAVSPAKQGSGVGRAMLAEAERLARSEYGAAFLRMTVIAQRAELIAWYERCGFARTGEREFRIITLPGALTRPSITLGASAFGTRCAVIEAAPSAWSCTSAAFEPTLRLVQSSTAR